MFRFSCIRTVLLAFSLICLFSGVAGCGKQDGNSASADGKTPLLTKITFIHDWNPEPEHGGYYTAAEKGYWKEQGLDVAVTIGGPNAEIEKRVALDEYTIGLCRGDAVLLAAQNGLPIVAVTPYFQHDEQGIMVREDSPVKTFADLEDKDVAMQIGNAWFIYLQKKYNLKKTRARPVTGSVANFVADPNWITQGYPTSEPFYAEKAGVKSRVLLISDSGFDPYRVVAVNQKLLKEHPEVVKAFVVGHYKGWLEYFRDPAPAHKRIHELNPTMSDEGMKFSYLKMREIHTVEGYADKGETMGAMTDRRWKDFRDIMVELKLLKPELDVTQYYTLDYTPDKMGINPALPPSPY